MNSDSLILTQSFVLLVIIQMCFNSRNRKWVQCTQWIDIKRITSCLLQKKIRMDLKVKDQILRRTTVTGSSELQFYEQGSLQEGRTGLGNCLERCVKIRIPWAGSVVQLVKLQLRMLPFPIIVSAWVWLLWLQFITSFICLSAVCCIAFSL